MQTNQWLEQFRGVFDCPSLELKLRSEWGAEHGTARSMIRNAISERTGQNMNDLTQLPNSEHFDISIAHCPGIGGFLLVEKPFSVGLDIEVEKRIQQSIVMRVSVHEELSLAPSAAHLWAAKEAAFKSLRGSTQPKVLSEIFINGWEKLEAQTEDAWRFKVSLSLTAPSIEGVGVVFRDNPFIVSLFCRDSST